MDYNTTQAALIRKVNSIKTMIDTTFDEARDSLEDLQTLLVRIENVIEASREVLSKCEEYR